MRNVFDLMCIGSLAIGCVLLAPGMTIISSVEALNGSLLDPRHNISNDRKVLRFFRNWWRI